MRYKKRGLFNKPLFLYVNILCYAFYVLPTFTFRPLTF